jgi:Zn-dependent protease with chaperone function
MVDESEKVAERSHDYDVVLFEGFGSRATSARGKFSLAGRGAQVTFFVQIAICVAFIASDHEIVLFAIGAVFSAQFFVLATRARMFVQPASLDYDQQARVTLMLKELCIEARCAVPRVRLKRTVMPVGLMARRGSLTLIISPDFAKSVDDRALRAVLAHEITHLKFDIQRARIRTQFILMGTYLVGLAAIWKFGNNSWTAYAALVIFYLPCVRLISYALSYQNQRREIRADLEGAAAVDDPDGMIRGLREVYELAAQMRQRVYSPTAWKWVLFPWSLRARSHPSLEDRIARLNVLASNQSGVTQVAAWNLPVISERRAD